MRNIKLVIQYDGTNYCGWQRQKNGLSIQELIEKALKRILGEDIKVTGAGRTDSGVHAKAQVASFRTSSSLAIKRVHKALNANLPPDISIRSVKGVGKKFNAQFNAKSKIYRYYIYNHEERLPFIRRYAVHIPYKLDINTMQEASRFLSGRHDFSSFRGSNSSVKTSVREIKKFYIKKKGSWITIDIEADGFLYNMVRAIVGTLIDVGRGKLGSSRMEKILHAKRRSWAGPTAPAKGLVLVRVKY